MSDTEKLIGIWKTNNPNTEGKNSNSSNSKTEVMDTIILYENREKAGRTKQVGAATILTILTIVFLYKVDLNVAHFIGLIMLIAGSVYIIIANKTDNFPGIRQLNTVEYLQGFKENIVKRTRMHKLNTLVSIFILAPGCYFTFRDSFPELGIWWMPLVIIMTLMIEFFWFKDYQMQSNEVMHKVNELLAEFNQN